MDPGCASHQGSAAKTFTFSNPTAAEFSTLVSSLSLMKILYLECAGFHRYTLYFDSKEIYNMFLG